MIGNCEPLAQPQGPPLVSCPRLLIQYMCSYPPYLEAVLLVFSGYLILTFVNGLLTPYFNLQCQNQTHHQAQ